MKNKVFSLFTLLFLVSCATQRSAWNTKSSKSPESGSAGGSKSRAKALTTPVLWHLIDPLDIELKLLNVDNNGEETIRVETALSQIELPAGHWQIVGFKWKGETFNVLNTSERFVFYVKKKTITYAGSLVIQCPKVSNQYHNELKEMSFFNRYHFGSEQRLCEMVVGNKFAAIKRTYQSLDKKSKLPLNQGF